MGRASHTILAASTAVLLLVLPPVASPQSLGSTAKPPKPCDLIIRSEITIDRPVEGIWPYFLDMGAWTSKLHFQTIKGQRGQEGEVRRVTPQGNPSYHPYLITTMRVTPLEQYVLKVTSEEGSDYFGFVDFSFTQTEGKTHLVYDIYVELKMAGQTEEESRKFCTEQDDSTRRDVSAHNRNLKLLVEGQLPPHFQ